MERMEILPRIMEARVRRVLERGKSVLLLGPRQTGKTTLLQLLQPDLLLNFLRPEVRQRYERAPQLLGAELEALAGRSRRRKPLVALDEVQRVRSEEHTSELQSPDHLGCRLLLEKKKNQHPDDN